MCGIAGFTGKKNEQLIQQMSTDMKHRGPDGDGFYIDEHVSLLNRRLAIIDRAGGDQPIYNEDKTIAVVYNGEIYNYLELRDTLKKAGHVFKTKSDTEVIVHGYEEWGNDCFDYFNGMFGIALYDIPKKKLILARDHFGIKPIYYAHTEKGLIFASEIKPILRSGYIEKKVNDRILYRYLAYRIHDDQEETFFEGVYHLMPGQMLTVENNNISKHIFSTLEKDIDRSIDQKNSQSLMHADIKKFKELFIDSIQRRLIAEVPVGTCLSGGLDSSSVVTVVNKLLSEHAKESESVGAAQNTFSAVFPGSTNNEEDYIDALLHKTHRVKSHKIRPKAEDFFDDLEDFVKTQEEPTISTGPYAQYAVMQEAAKHVTVLLDGQGADEMMAGYLPYYIVYLRQLFNTGAYLTLFREMWSARDILLSYLWYGMSREFAIKTDVDVRTLLQSSFSEKFVQEEFVVSRANLKKRLKEDIFQNSLPSLLRYEDKNSMRFSIEGRVPFLDFRLVKYLFSLPEEAIIKNGWNKYILRKSMKDLLPSQIRNRRNKIGFTTPEHEWFMRMKNRIYGIFLSESFASRPYFNQTEVLQAFRKFIEGKNEDTLLFWRVLNVELWLREFIDSNKREERKEKSIKGILEANEGKKLEIEVEGDIYKRYPIRTELFQKGDEYAQKIAKYIGDFIDHMSSPTLIGDPGMKNLDSRFRENDKGKWYVIVSEKIVAISQGRSFFIWDINPSWWARTLSGYVTKTPYGIGLGSPWTMQIAIDEVGLARILFATIAAAVTKPFGIKGLFYRLAGNEINAIDGPTEYSVYPSNVSAKLAPKDPQVAAQKIREEILKMLTVIPAQAGIQTLDPGSRIKSGMTNYEILKRVRKDLIKDFGGVVIIDANDLGRNVLGNATEMPNIFFEKAMRDNPMGQGSEQTPLVFMT